MAVTARDQVIDRAAMAVFEHTPTTGRRRLTDDTATAREIAELVLETANHWGAVEALEQIALLLEALPHGVLTDNERGCLERAQALALPFTAGGQ